MAGPARKSIIDACNHSLRRLQTDYIDLYWMHNYDPHTPIEESMAALDNLVQAGKVRYIGVSDTPAWKIAEANTLAHFRGWAPFAAMQIEYPLLERTVEQELIPMGADLNIGVMPWSPLRAGILSGKFTRDSAGKNEGARSAARADRLTDDTYDLIDELGRIAKKHDTTIARVALAWVTQQPGVTSTIIGARTMHQLEDNIGATDITIDTGELDRLSEMTTPQLTFPQSYTTNFATVRQAGTSINGDYAEINPGFIQPGDQVH
ncbi:aldo/keto reductase [Streptomyces sp. NPDC014995]|uniref:aldo/keto reductase n=1 Tax=Streptomyces sp. NPDC014995 TaxID=3364936 RepID=UPI0036F9EAD8